MCTYPHSIVPNLNFITQPFNLTETPSSAQILANNHTTSINYSHRPPPPLNFSSVCSSIWNKISCEILFEILIFSSWTVIWRLIFWICWNGSVQRKRRRRRWNCWIISLFFEAFMGFLKLYLRQKIYKLLAAVMGLCMMGWF
jgi:hypothetical protein